MAKYFQVKVYNKAGTYLTTWKDVVTNIEFNNEINSAGGQMKLTLARNAGDYGEGSDVDFGHRVKVYVFDKEEPNGLLLFQGFISGYTPIYKNDKVDVTILSYGAELTDFILEGGEAFRFSQSNISSYEMFGAGGVAFIGSYSVAQTFTASGTYKIRRFEVRMETTSGYNNATGEYFYNKNVPVQATIRTGGTAGSGTLLGTSNIIYVIDETNRPYSFIFDPSVQFTNGSFYNIVISALESATGNDQYLVSIDTGSGLAGGSMWREAWVEF